MKTLLKLLFPEITYNVLVCLKSENLCIFYYLKELGEYDFFVLQDMESEIYKGLTSWLVEQEGYTTFCQKYLNADNQINHMGRTYFEKVKPDFLITLDLRGNQ